MIGKFCGKDEAWNRKTLPLWIKWKTLWRNKWKTSHFQAITDSWLKFSFRLILWGGIFKHFKALPSVIAVTLIYPKNIHFRKLKFQSILLKNSVIRVKYNSECLRGFFLFWYHGKVKSKKINWRTCSLKTTSQRIMVHSWARVE